MNYDNSDYPKAQEYMDRRLHQAEQHYPVPAAKASRFKRFFVLCRTRPIDTDTRFLIRLNRINAQDSFYVEHNNHCSPTNKGFVA